LKVILTGAGGYIALHILNALLGANHTVTAIVRSPQRLGPFGLHPQLVVIQSDLEEVSRIEQILPGHDVCIHTAIIWGQDGDELEMRDTKSRYAVGPWPSFSIS
jgi:UDP-glucose 4-epimerase